MHWAVAVAVASCCHQRTFWKQAIVPRLCVLPQEPPITEVIVAFYELHPVAPAQTELVGTPRDELICIVRSASKKAGCITCRGPYERRRECRPVCTAPCGTAACLLASVKLCEESLTALSAGGGE